MFTNTRRRFSGALPFILAFALLVLGLSPAEVALAQQAGARKARPAVDALTATILVRTTLVALNNANLTGDYSVLRELGEPGFQLVNTPASLADAFRRLRAEKIDLAPIVVIRPVFTAVPFINRQGLLVLQGYFPSRPKVVIFVLGYKPVARRWRLAYINVRTALASSFKAAGKGGKAVKKASGRKKRGGAKKRSKAARGGKENPKRPLKK